MVDSDSREWNGAPAGRARSQPAPDGSPVQHAASEPPAAPEVPAGPSKTADPSTGLRHLFAVTAVVSAVLVGYMVWADARPQSSLVVLVSLTAAFGGLLSAYRRFRLIGAEETLKDAQPAKALLFHVYLSPVLGGMFGVILYLVMLTGFIEGDFFPRFRDLEKPYDGLFALFHSTVPAENKDAIKAVFWAFIAGFSEGFVPALLGRVGRQR